MPPLFTQHVYQPIIDHSTILHTQQLHPRDEKLKHPLWGNKTLLTKLMILFGAVLAITLIAASTGFFICCLRQLHRRRKRVSAHVDKAAQPMPRFDIVSEEVTGFSEFDERQMHQMTQIMANNAFSGRELEVLKAERKSKKKRALLVMDPSTATEMPIQFHYLKRKLQVSSNAQLPPPLVVSCKPVAAGLNASLSDIRPRLPSFDGSFGQHLSPSCSDDKNDCTRDAQNKQSVPSRSATCPAHIPGVVVGKEHDSKADGDLTVT